MNEVLAGALPQHTARPPGPITDDPPPTIEPNIDRHPAFNLDAHQRAILAVRFATRLARLGWFEHQQAADVIKAEAESTFLSQRPFTADEAAATLRIQHLFDTFVAAKPAPELTFPLPTPHDAANAAVLPWSSSARPSERSFSFTPANLDHASVMWKSLVLELAAGKARSIMGRAAGVVFLVLQEGRKPRLIYWPKEANTLLSHIPISYGRINDLFSILAACGVKLDLKSAYRSIRVALQDAEYLGAVVDGIWIVFLALPFGLASSPAIFTLALAETLRRFRSSMPATLAAIAAIAAFVDDLGSGSDSTLNTLHIASLLIEALLRDGWWLSIAKAFLLPAARLYYTGLVALFDHQALAIHPAKAQKLYHLALTISFPRQILEEATLAVQTLWNHRRDTLPPHLPLPDRRPLPDLQPFLSQLQLRTSESIDLDGPSFAALRRLTGTISWFQTVLPWLCVWRRVAEQPIWTNRWTPDAVSAILLLIAVLPSLSDWTRSIRPIQPTISIIVDASETGWGAAILFEGACDFCAGSLPPALIGESAPLREAFGAREALTASFDARFPFASAALTLDAATVVGAASGGMRSLAFAPVLASFAAYEVQGLRLDFLHERRTEGLHPIVDALSAAARADWTLRHEVAASIWLATHGWDVHLATDHHRALAPAYTTAAAAGARSAILEQLTAQQEHRSAAVGWLAHGLDFVPRAGLVAFAFPRWSQLVPLLNHHYAHPFPLILIAPEQPDAFWAAPLARFAQACDTIWSLPPDASIPPVEERPPHLRFDPRRLAAYWFAGASAPHARPPPRFAGATPVELRVIHHGSTLGTPARTAYARSGRCPGDGPFATLFTAAGCTTAHDGTRHAAPAHHPTHHAPHRGRAPRVVEPRTAAHRYRDASTHPAPRAAATQHATAPVRKRPRDAAGATPGSIYAHVAACIGAAARASAAVAPSTAPTHHHASHSARVTDGTAELPHPTTAHDISPPRMHGGARAPAAPTALSLTRHRAHAADERTEVPLPIAPPRAAAPPPRDAARAPAAASPQHDAAAEPPPPTATALCLRSADAVTTIGAWLHAIRTFITCDDDGACADEIPPQLRSGVAEARRTIRMKLAAGSSRSARAPRYMLQLATALRLLDTPFTLRIVDALAVTYAVHRLSPTPPFGWQRVRCAATIESDLSTLSTTTSKAGLPTLPPACGPLALQYLKSRGSHDKQSNSDAWPIHTSDLLAAEPPTTDRGTWIVWAALVVLSFFCLRPGVLRHLTRQMFVQYERGYILCWRFVSKTSAGDILETELRTRAVHVSAARHPVLTRIFAAAPATGPMFANATDAAMSAFVREHVSDVPISFSIRVYGVRVAADIEALELGVPKDTIDALFWWRRLVKSTRMYYGALCIRIMFIFSEARARLSFRHFTPGRYDAHRSGPLPDFSTPAKEDTLPPLPRQLIAQLDAAWAAESPSLVQARAERYQRHACPLLWDAAIAPGAPAPVIPDLPDGSDLSVDCLPCGRHVSRFRKATRCENADCPNIVCLTCHPNPKNAICWWCPDHQASKRRRT